MANRYANLVGTKKISEDFNNINIGFDRVQAEMDTKGTPADAQAKADAAKAAAIATAAEALAAHKARGADEHPTAKGNAAGFMSAADKILVDARTSAATPDTLMQRDAAGRAKVAAPAASDDIARKAETDAVQTNLESHAADTDIHVTADDHDKLDGIAAGAEVNQNAFAKVNDVEASSKSDTLQLTGGVGITVSTNPATKQVTITSTGESTPGAHASSHVTGGADVIPDAVKGGASGLMSGADAKFVREDGESKTGAQAKADAAETAAKEYTDGQIEGIADRLDTPERSAITLQSGIQVVQADQDSPFSLSGLTGRTLVNLLGRVGGGERIPSIDSSNAATLSVDTSTKDTGLSSYKVTANVANAEHYIDLSAINVKAGSFYVAVGMAKPAANATASILAYGTNAGEELDFVIPSDTMSVASVFSPAVVLFKSTTAVKARVRLRVQNTAGEVIYTPNGEYANFDSIRLYEVNETEYAALANMTPEQVAAKYPYVDSVQPVRNPYTIRYGENLLPPFYEAELATGAQVISPYSLSYTLTGSSVNVGRFWVPVVEGQTYTLTPGLVNGDNFQVIGFADDKTTITMPSLGVVRDTVIFSVPAGSGTKYIRLTVISGDFTGTLTVTKPMLNIGSTPRPFKPREDAMLALQTDLFADPLTGTNADEVFEKDGQYFKLAKWRKGTLDGSLLYAHSSSNSSTGYKAVYVEGVYNDAVSRSAIVAKFDGKVLNLNASLTASDIQNGIVVGNPTRLFLTISSADSGWGDSYTPSTDEIKAYFMGWKMYTQAQPVDGIYPGTGTKAWVEIPWKDKNNDTNISQHVSYTLPTTQAPNFTPYQLVYQLATPIVEAITSEGQLTLIEGNNQVEVGTGIVLRERANPYLWANNGLRYINSGNVNWESSRLKSKVSSIKAIYKDGKLDTSEWTIFNHTDAAPGYGNQYARSVNYDPSAAYSVTYLMLDASPVVPFVGSVPDNEKALLTDLVQDLQEASARLSVVENKKAEKDVPVPAWITPTLLNSWVRHSTARPTLRYYKDSQGVVHLEGVIRSGVVTSGTSLCNLPAGYRPALTVSCVSYSSNGSAVGVGLIDVLNDGTIQLGTTGTPTFYNGLMFIALSFLAEQ